MREFHVTNPLLLEDYERLWSQFTFWPPEALKAENVNVPSIFTIILVDAQISCHDPPPVGGL
jgi:hypothetical protein